VHLLLAARNQSLGGLALIALVITTRPAYLAARAIQRGAR
jgi:hypothetical protein